MIQSLFKRLIPLFLVIFLMASCSVEHKIASSYVKKKSKGAVLVLSPDTVFMVNARDSMAHTSRIDSTRFLRLINEKVFVKASLTHLRKRLLQMGFEVFDENSLDEYMNESDSSYILKLAQVEIEEGVDFETLRKAQLNKRRDTIAELNYVSFNTWFELGRKNVLNETFPLLYCSFMLNDELYEDYSSSLSLYVYEPISIYDFYAMPEYLGKNYAEYFYDYVMNIYILDHLPEDIVPNYYYHFDQYYKVLSPLPSDGGHFIELEEEY